MPNLSTFSVIFEHKGLLKVHNSCENMHYTISSGQWASFSSQIRVQC